MPSISATSYSKAHTCHRLFYYEQILKLTRVRDDGARRFGTLYHKGLESWWGAMDQGDVPWRDADAALVAALGAIYENARHIDTDPYEVARAEAMMVAYHARWFELEFESLEGASTEVWFDVPLTDGDGIEFEGWRLVGRKDALKLFPDGKIRPVEHKTTSSDIGLGSDYWARLALDMQVSVYIAAAQAMGIETDSALYDASRKPGLKPGKATPAENVKMTKGKGCSYCGGRAGGKGGVAQGTGRVMKEVLEAGRKVDVEAECPACAGSGWNTPPAVHAKTRLEDEPVADFKARVAEEIASDPNAYFRQGIVKRTPDQLANARENLVVTAQMIESLLANAKRMTSGGSMSEERAMRCFAQNTAACTNIYGSRCDYMPACTGEVDPFNSALYTIGRKP